MVMGLTIDELLPEEEKHDKITEQVEAIKRSHGKQFPPNYALTWVLANQVVQRYYGRYGLDAIPVWRDSFGWSQFNLTRATNCQQPTNKADESQRYIVFDAIVINWKTQGGVDGTNEAQYDLNNAVWIRHQPPNTAVEEALTQLNLDDQEAFDHSACLHGPHTYAYTKLFQVVTDLICHAPEMVGKREIVLDLDHFGNPYAEAVHPLCQSGLAEPGITREWFELFHIPANSRLYINIFTGDILQTAPDDSWHVLDYPGWNERNEEQLKVYFAEMLRIPLE